MNAFGRPGSTPLLLAVVGMAAALATFVVPVEPPHPGINPNAFTVRLRSAGPGTALLYYHVGAGFNESLTRRVEVPGSAGFVRIALPLPSGRIVGLRLDPTDTGRPVTLRDAEIVDSRGRVLHRFSPNDFRKDYGVASLRIDGEELLVTPLPGTNQPDLYVGLRQSLNLPADSRPGGVVARERILAAGLFLAGVIFLGLLRKRRADGPVPAALTVSLLVFAAVSVIFSRRPDVVANPQFWAEDGTIYFTQRADGWRGLQEVQGNYLVLLPRAAAAAANFAPVAWAPAIYVCVALAVMAAAAVKAASPRVGLPFPVWAALAVVLVPDMDEIAVNLTNAQWFGALILLLVAISRPAATRGEAIRDGAAVGIFGLTGPFVIFFWPIFLWRAVRARAGSAWLTLGLASALAYLQLLAYRHSSPATLPQVPLDWPKMLAAAGYRTGSRLLGLMPSPDYADPVRWGLAGLAFYILLWCAFPLRTEQGDSRPALALAAAAIIAGGVLRYLSQIDVFFQPVFLLRYFYLPVLFGFWLLLGGLSRPGWRRPAAAALLVLVVGRNLPCYRMQAYTDLDWPRFAAAIQKGQETRVPINPPAWNFLSPASSPR